MIRVPAYVIVWASLVILLGLFSSCVLHVEPHDVRIDGDGTWTLDRVELEHTRQVDLAIDAWPAAGLELDNHVGNVVVVGGGDSDRITVEVHEVAPGDATLSLDPRTGELVARSAEGAPVGIGRIEVRCATALPSLDIETSIGDVEVLDAAIHGELDVESSAGDVRLSGVKAADARIDTGLGDCRLEGCKIGEARVESGCGDVQLHGCDFVDVRADTGLGSIDARASSWVRNAFDTGLGDVHVSGVGA